MSDRFHQPERASDPRRVFIPAPSSAPSRGSDGAAPSRPRRPVAERPAPPGARRGGPGGPDGPDGRGGPPSARPPDGRSRLRRVRWRRVLLVTGVVLVLCMLGAFLYARSIFNRIDRVEVSGSLTSAENGTNYLIVGSDSRENVQEEGDAGFNGTEGPAGSRADTMMLLHLEGGKAQMLSIPRDLYVPISGTDGSSKINAAYNTDLGGGPERLVDTITESLGVPIDRYMEVDFVSFAGLVDSLGGITIDFEHPARDQQLGFQIDQTGPVELDGDQALAYVRSRQYEELKDGQWVKDPRGDLGRIERQQKFLSVVIDKMSGTKNPFSLASAAGSMSEGLRIDDAMSMFDAMRFAWGMRGMAEPLEPLPVDNDRNASGAVLILREDEAQPILDQVR